MGDIRYTDEFKIEVVKQTTEHGYPVQDVTKRLGISTHSLYAWRKKYSSGEVHAAHLDDNHAETKLLRTELKRVTEERDILKKATAYFANESL